MSYDEFPYGLGTMPSIPLYGGCRSLMEIEFECKSVVMV